MKISIISEPNNFSVQRPAGSMLRDLRLLGFRSDCADFDNSIKSQIKCAVRDGTDWVVILREEELNRGEVIVKNLGTSENFIKQIDDVLFFFYKNSRDHAEIRSRRRVAA